MMASIQRQTSIYHPNLVAGAILIIGFVIGLGIFFSKYQQQLAREHLEQEQMARLLEQHLQLYFDNMTLSLKTLAAGLEQQGPSSLNLTRRFQAMSEQSPITDRVYWIDGSQVITFPSVNAHQFGQDYMVQQLKHEKAKAGRFWGDSILVIGPHKIQDEWMFGYALPLKNTHSSDAVIVLKVDIHALQKTIANLVVPLDYLALQLVLAKTDPNHQHPYIDGHFGHEHGHDLHEHLSSEDTDHPQLFTLGSVDDVEEWMSVPIALDSSGKHLHLNVQNVRGWTSGNKALYWLISMFFIVTLLAMGARTFLSSRERVHDRKVNEALRISLHENQEMRRLAESASSAKSDFLRNMSHEMRTPLNGVYGLLQVLVRDQNLAKDQHNLVLAAYTSIARLKDIVQELFDMMRIEQGNLKLESFAFDFDQMMQSAISQYRHRAVVKSLNFNFRSEKSAVGFRWGDPVRIAQVISYVLDNAVKYTEVGTIDMAVSSSYEEVIIRVQDTGIGMSNSTLGNVFEPFSQADMGLTKRFDGVGLGLSLCRSFVDLMGGDISIRSEKGEGTTVLISLPLKSSGNDVPALAASHGSHLVTSAPTPLVLPKGLKILVADDNPINRRIVLDLLDQYHINAHEVDDGLGIIEHYRQYDLLITDIMMPNMNGDEAVKTLRMMGAKIPAIAITGVLGEEDVMDLEAAGFSEVLFKPLDQHLLLKAIIKALNLVLASSRIQA